MRYLNKTIDNIILIDIFTKEERLSSANQITKKLSDFLTTKQLPSQPFYPNSEAELIEVLQKISIIKSNGLIIHFIGHGGDAKAVFGNNNFLVKWTDIRELLVNININTEDSLIINATIICYGHNIFQLIAGDQKPFYAAIGSTTSNSLQALSHNIELYNKCLTRDIARYWLGVINGNLKDSQGGQNRYELEFA